MSLGLGAIPTTFWRLHTGKKLGSLIAWAPASSTIMATTPPTQYSPRYIDIGINLADPIFRGRYHGKQRHPDDLQAVINRAHSVGCQKLIVTGSDLKNSEDALELTRQFPGTVFSTVGIHPCSSAIFSASHPGSTGEHTHQCDPDPSQPISEDTHSPDPEKTTEIIQRLEKFVQEARWSAQRPGLVAFGEFGLDYDRLHYCPKNIQLHSFAAQLKLAASLRPQLPLFLHSRAAHKDFVKLLKASFGEKLEKLEKGAVVHSFTGTVEEMQELVSLGLYIGVNGCSFKTVDNCSVVKEMQLGHIMLETDGPWCEVRPSHEGWKHAQKQPAPPANTVEGSNPVTDKNPRRQKGQKQAAPNNGRFKVVKKEKWEEGAMVKGRNEPCSIETVGAIVAGIQEKSVEEVCEAAWQNTVAVFGLGGGGSGTA